MDEDNDSEHEDILKILESDDDDDLITVRDENEKEEKLDEGKENRGPQNGQQQNQGIFGGIELIFA